jgi:hypothetical protein
MDLVFISLILYQTAHMHCTIMIHDLQNLHSIRSHSAM